jgi:hypothetical protein
VFLIQTSLHYRTNFFFIVFSIPQKVPKKKIENFGEKKSGFLGRGGGGKPFVISYFREVWLFVTIRDKGELKIGQNYVMYGPFWNFQEFFTVSKSKINVSFFVTNYKDFKRSIWKMEKKLFQLLVSHYDTNQMWSNFLTYFNSDFQ